MKNIVISILVLLILCVIFSIFYRENFQNIEGNYKISELIDYEEIKSIFKVETENIPEVVRRNEVIPVATSQVVSSSGSDSSLLAELMEFMAAITREGFTNSSVRENFTGGNLTRVSLPRDFLNRILNDGNIRNSYKDLIYNYNINNDEINEALENQTDVRDTLISLKNILCRTIVSLKFNKTLKKLAVDLLMFNVNNGDNISQVVYDENNTARFNIANNPIDGESNSSSFEKMVESCVIIYNNSLISRVLNEYLNTETQRNKFYNDIKESVNHVLCNLKGVDNIPGPDNSSSLMCGGFADDLNIKVELNDGIFSVVKSSPSCSFSCPVFNLSNITQPVTTKVLERKTEPVNYDLNFTASTSSSQLNYYITLSKPNNNVTINGNVVNINTSGVFTLKFLGFRDKIHLYEPFVINITANDVTIDGGNNLIYINMEKFDNGLIRHHQGSKVEVGNAVNRCIVKNFDVYLSLTTNETSSSKVKGYGGLCSSNFGARGEGNVIKDCVVHCNSLGNGGGGIVGSHAGFEGSLVISGCIFVGNLYMINPGSFKSCGGIAGSYLGEKGKVLIHNCKTLGHINENYSGGITADYTGADGGKVVISNCTLAGNINGKSAMEEGSGGICGGNCATDTVNYNNSSLKSIVFIVNCNVLGEMPRSIFKNLGGLIGSNAGMGGDIFMIGCRTHFDTAMMNSDNGYFIGSISKNDRKTSQIYVIHCSNKHFTDSYPTDLLVGDGNLDSNNVIFLSGYTPYLSHYKLPGNYLQNSNIIRKQFPLTTLSLTHSNKIFSIDNNSIFNDKTDFNIDISLSENWNSNITDPNCNTMMMSSGHYTNLNMLKNSKLNTICPVDDDPYVDIYSLHTIYEDENKSNTNFDTCKYKSLEFCNNETNCNYELFSRSGGSDYMCIPSNITNFGSSGSSGTPDCAKNIGFFRPPTAILVMMHAHVLCILIEVIVIKERLN